MTQLEDANTRLERELQHARAALDLASAEFRAKVAKERATAEDATGRVEGLRADFNRVADERDALKQELDQARARLADCEAQRERRFPGSATAESLYVEATSHLMETRRQLAEALSRIAEADSERDTARKERDEARAACVNQAAALRAEATRLVEMSEHADKPQDAFAERAAQLIGYLNSELKNARDQLKRVTDAFNAFRENANESLAQIRDDNADMRQALEKGYLDTLEAQRSQIATLTGQRDDLRTDLGRATAVLEETKSFADRWRLLEQRIAVVERERDAALDAARRLRLTTETVAAVRSAEAEAKSEQAKSWDGGELGRLRAELAKVEAERDRLRLQLEHNTSEWSVTP